MNIANLILKFIAKVTEIWVVNQFMILVTKLVNNSVDLTDLDQIWLQLLYLKIINDAKKSNDANFDNLEINGLILCNWHVIV